MSTFRAPQAFLSHAHADHSIAKELATKLRALGVEAWLDTWEIAPGDSLIEKIFEHGLKDCDLFLILLSPQSIQSKWVAAELDVALVGRIEKATRVVPVVVQECETPTSLRALLRVELATLGVDEVAKRLADVAFGRGSEKPPVAARSTRLNSVALGLSANATLTAQVLLPHLNCEAGIPEIVPNTSLALEVPELSAQQLSDAVDELDEMGLVKAFRTLGSHPFSFSDAWPNHRLARLLGESGLLTYDYENDILRVAVAVAAKDAMNGAALAEATGLAPYRINNAGLHLSDLGLLKLLDCGGTQPFMFMELHATAATRRFVEANAR